MSDPANSDPETNVILVVHGIGEQSPGMTIAGLAGAAAHRMGIYGGMNGRVDLLVESDENDQLLRQFPCTIRTAEFQSDEISARPQRVLAGEVYWADISSAPRGAMATIVELFQTILGLGYLALDNVDHARNATGPEDRPIGEGEEVGVWPAQRMLVRGFVRVFYTLIAPFNAALLLGSLLLLAFGRPGQSWAGFLTILLPLLLGAACFLAGLLWHRLLKRKDSTYLLRAFMTGLIGIGAALLAVAGLSLVIGTGWLDPARVPLNPGTCEVLVQGGPGALSPLSHPQLCVVAGWLVMGMSTSYVLAVVFLCGMFLLAPVEFLWRASRAGLGGGLGRHPLKTLTGWIATKQTIHIPICNAMLLSWTLISASFWSLFSTFIRQLGDRGAEGAGSGSVLVPISSLFDALPDPAIDSGPRALLVVEIYDRVSGMATATLPYIMSAFILVALVSAVVLVYRQLNKESLAGESATALEVWVGRLILNPIISFVLFLCVLWVTLGTVMAVQTVLNVDIVASPSGLIDLHRTMTALQPAVLAVAGVMGLVIYQFWQSISAGLGVVRDISTYSTRSHPYLRPDMPGQYPLRDRILKRFDIVERHLRAQLPDPDRVIIVAHSLGTMIAFAAIARPDRQDRPIFVSMGSPLGHIYHHYFPRSFALDRMLRKVGPWLNIYRCDDFVGTRVSLSRDVPLNRSVGPRGHVGYWTDREVWDKVIATLRAEPPQLRTAHHPRRAGHRQP